MTSADLRTLAAFLTSRKWPLRAAIASWGANQIDQLTNWQSVAQGQLTQLQADNATLTAQVAPLQQQITADQATIDQLNATSGSQVATIQQLSQQVNQLQAQLAAATMSPVSLVLVGTHLHGFATEAAAQAFIQANSNQSPAEFGATDFTWHPTT